MTRVSSEAESFRFFDAPLGGLRVLVLDVFVEFGGLFWSKATGVFLASGRFDFGSGMVVLARVLRFAGFLVGVVSGVLGGVFVGG